MTKIIIETNDSKNKIRKLSDEALTEVEQLFEEKITVFLTDFMCDKKFFGLYRSYYWKEEPKMSIRMFLFNFDGKHGTNYFQCIFGDNPLPHFMLRNKKLREKICHALFCEPSFRRETFDQEVDLRERMLEKFLL